MGGCKVYKNAKTSVKVNRVESRDFPVEVGSVLSPADWVRYLFFNTIFVSSHMYPENPEGTQVLVGSMIL